MSLAPAIAGTAAATSAADFTLADHVFIYIGAAILFGLIGLVPLLAEKPEPQPTLETGTSLTTHPRIRRLESRRNR
ncbi:hypothetical protein UA18_00380 [Burkholderia multivorans]|uniref:MFS transporter n=1 Tax=Burkholderia multivorans TaxID=87883 RepID=A0ABD7LFC2_9BURK|nr:hypothetical protein [Burkholderia multivorans]SAK12274.1 hypothetical protein UA18_00380 [Burkholderia multivorans]SAK13724.1 hypothetical protein UA17_00719 [Burkholderia multivorans]HEF5154550.1 hypothetical protein [Burkholderia multivorans]